MGGPGRRALVAGLLALLFGVVVGFEVTVHADFGELHEKPKIDSHLGLATNEKLQVAQPKFDLMTFSQRWPGTYCQQEGSCCHIYEQPATFTMNGIWPDYEDGTYPKCCNGPAFEEGASISGLQLLWPRVTCSSPTLCNGTETESLWESEWQKHGSCAYPSIDGARTYFLLAAIFAQSFPVTEILNNAGFVPDGSQEYDTSKIIAAVQAAAGARPTVTCKGNQIYEVQICMTNEIEITNKIEFRDCLSSSDSCPSTLLIPPFESSSNSHRFSFTPLRRK